MITTVIKRNSKYCFGRLARYLAAAEEKEEKLGMLWVVNCKAGDTIDRLDHIINEIEATQYLNVRGTRDRSYHLVLSFKDERPPDADLAAIEREFANALGLGEHQRVAATHTNTANFHAHIAYNRVHPQTRKLNGLPFDYYTRDRIARAIEEKYGLKKGRGADYQKHRNSLPPKARGRETRCWEQSFAGYVLELGSELDYRLAIAKSWEEFHASLAEFGLMIEPWKKGLVIMDVNQGESRVAASILGRDFGKPGIEKLLGPFEPARGERPSKVIRRFEPHPLTQHEGQGQLWEQYMADGVDRSKLIKVGYSGWRGFLEAKAVSDPLAWDIIDHYERQLREAALEKEIDMDRGVSL